LNQRNNEAGEDLLIYHGFLCGWLKNSVHFNSVMCLHKIIPAFGQSFQICLSWSDHCVPLLQFLYYTDQLYIQGCKSPAHLKIISIASYNWETCTLYSFR
jgi:hypothetical protein